MRKLNTFIFGSNKKRMILTHKTHLQPSKHLWYSPPLHNCIWCIIGRHKVSWHTASLDKFELLPAQTCTVHRFAEIIHQTQHQIIHQRAHTIWAVGNIKGRRGKPWSRGVIKTYSEYFWGKRYTFKEWTLSRRKSNTNLHFCEVFNAMPILSKIGVYLTAYFWKVGKQQLS